MTLFITMAKLYVFVLMIMCIGRVNLSNFGEDNKHEDTENDPFIPTKDWQRVKKGQSIPAGIHSRLNLQTGVVEAKLLEDERENTALSSVPVEDKEVDSSNDFMHSEDVNSRARKLGDMLSKVSEADLFGANTAEEDVKKKFRSYEEIKKEFQDLKMSIKTDSEIIAELLERFKDTSKPDEIVNILKDLDYLLHQADNAVNFANDGGLKLVVIPSLNSSHNDVIIAALQLLGSASQSNPKVQIAALEAGAVERVLRLVQKAELSSSALHALSCVIRRFPLAQKTFIKYGGPAILAELFKKSPKIGNNPAEDINFSWRARIKAVTLLHDMVVEQQQVEGEARTQYLELGLKEQIISHNWCKLFPSLLAVEDDHDAAEKGAEAMLAYWDTCRFDFLRASTIIFQAEKHYSELSVTELSSMSPDASDDSPESGYFTEMAELVTTLGQRLRLMKEEL